MITLEHRSNHLCGDTNIREINDLLSAQVECACGMTDKLEQRIFIRAGIDQFEHFRHGGTGSDVCWNRDFI